MNIPPSIIQKIGRNLHNVPNHPIEIMKRHIYQYFESLPDYNFVHFDNLDPVVSVEDNFDKLLIPEDHPARSKSDTYYMTENTVLRTHTSAHQNILLSQGHTSFLVVGDVYRKDEIDRNHYPVFHQMEGLSIVPDGVDPEQELIKILTGLVQYLYPDCDYRINPDYFPFTNPSFEIEVKFDGKWLEILGCGVVHPTILAQNNIFSKAFAFGLGLERLCMRACEIPDIRYFWTNDLKFLNQFEKGILNKFQPYSNLPSEYNDISFWIDSDRMSYDKWLDENDFFDIIRDIGGEWVEKIELRDKFYHNKKQLNARMYRIYYSPTADIRDPSELSKIAKQTHEAIRVACDSLVELR
jgi:phenylalanyl-tRNA synthetase alpha chain